jgi:hypothetical protein
MGCGESGAGEQHYHWLPAAPVMQVRKPVRWCVGGGTLRMLCCHGVKGARCRCTTVTLGSNLQLCAHSLLNAHSGMLMVAAAAVVWWWWVAGGGGGIHHKCNRLLAASASRLPAVPEPADAQVCV